MRVIIGLSFVVAAAASLAFIPVNTQGAITSGLVGHWSFDETSGTTAADSSGQGNPAEIGNVNGDAPTWVPGKIGNSLLLRGSDNGQDYAIVQNFPKPTATYSVSAWAWFDERATWPQSGIVENGVNRGGPIGLVIRNKNVDQAFGPLGGTATAAGGTVDLQDSVGFPTASWQQVGVVADGTQLKLYRNGAVVASGPYSGDLGAAPTPALGIGTILDDGGSPFTGFLQGKIDDVGVWTNALSDAQMAAIFAAGQAQKDLSHADEYLVSPPNISTQPKSLVRFAGESATFTVTSAGTAPFTYQWKLNNTPITGATNASYNIPSVNSAHAGSYTVAVSNSAGQAESSAATLAVNAADFSTGLLGYWTFDETQGDVAADASAGKHPVNLANFTAGDNSRWVAGRVGGALQMDGASAQYGYVEDYEKPVSTMTASAWVWADTLGTWATFLKNWGDASAGQFHFGLFTDGHENIYIKQADGKTPNVSDPSVFPTNSWQHVAFVCDGTRLRLYRNGAEVASAAYDGTLVKPPMNCIGIGTKLADSCDAPASSATGPWQGKLDDIGLWTRGLSAKEIFALFKAGEAGKGILEANAFLPAQPVITLQPSPATVFENAPVILSAGATGADPLTYQWFKDGAALTNGTSASLDLGRVTLASAGSYRLRVTNVLGSAESDAVVVAVSARPPATLVSEWKFENNLADTSGNGNEGTAVGTVEYVAGKFGKAVRLAPGNPVVKESANGLPLSATNSWSINVWVNLAEEPTSLAYLAGFGPVLDAGGGTARALLAFSGPNANNILFWGNGNDTATPNRYPTNRWAMITITYAADQKTLAVLLDGTQIASNVKTLADVPADSNQISLAPTSNWTVDAGGDFDEFSIWNGMLLPSQISALLDPTGGPVQLSVQQNGSKVSLSWAAAIQGFSLESSDVLGSGVWTPVSGVQNNKVDVDPTAAHRFFRLKR